MTLLDGMVYPLYLYIFSQSTYQRKETFVKLKTNCMCIPFCSLQNYDQEVNIVMNSETVPEKTGVTRCGGRKEEQEKETKM